MNKIFSLALGAALLAPLGACKSDKTPATCDDAIECIMTRSSVRSYTNQAIPDTVITDVLKAAMAAPTAANKQPWAFVVLNNREALDSLSAHVPQWKMLAEAQAAIVVCGDMARCLDGDGHDFWIQDASAATENLLLAAHALGLGAVWCGVYPIAERVSAVSEAVGLPDDIVPLCVVAMGYPSGPAEPKDKWDPAKVHYNRW
ncbi:MAG: nitroreductase family protein [Bacteroidales bacterium]|nr:nitroreductase family protein [Bacteroidales bacterium]